MAELFRSRRRTGRSSFGPDAGQGGALSVPTQDRAEENGGRERPARIPHDGCVDAVVPSAEQECLRRGRRTQQLGRQRHARRHIPRERHEAALDCSPLGEWRTIFSEPRRGSQGQALRSKNIVLRSKNIVLHSPSGAARGEQCRCSGTFRTPARVRASGARQLQPALPRKESAQPQVPQGAKRLRNSVSALGAIFQRRRPSHAARSKP